MHHLNRIASKDLVIGLPKLKFERNKLCEACQKGKQTKSSFKPINVVICNLFAVFNYWVCNWVGAMGFCTGLNLLRGSVEGE